MPIFILFKTPRIFSQLVIMENHGIVSTPFIHLSNLQFLVYYYIYVPCGENNLLAFILSNCHADVCPHIESPVVLSHLPKFT